MDKICDNCGKTFIIHPGWLYKLTVEHRIRNYCCFNCYETVRKKIKTPMRYDK